LEMNHKLLRKPACNRLKIFMLVAVSSE